MHVVEGRVHLDYLDIGVEPIEMSDEFLGVGAYTGYEYLSPISRGPDDVVLRFVYGMGAFPKSHAESVSQRVCRLDAPTSPDRVGGFELGLLNITKVVV